MMQPQQHPGQQHYAPHQGGQGYPNYPGSATTAYNNVHPGAPQPNPQVYNGGGNVTYVCIAA